MIGALASFFTADPRPNRATIIGGTLFGIVIFAAYAVGINLLPVTELATARHISVTSSSRFTSPCIDPRRL